MRMLLVLALSLFSALVPAAAFASDQAKPGESSLFIGQEICKWAVEHAPDADVSYRGGVDVNGNPVAAASMAEQRDRALAEKILRRINIELTSDLARQLGIPPKVIRQQLNVGTVEIDENGEMTVNGEPLVNPDPSAWVEACAQAKDR